MKFEAYCDESRPEHLHCAARIQPTYMLLGSLWVEAARRAEYKAEIARLRSVHAVGGEMKWRRVSPSRSSFYSELVRLLFDTDMRFRCVVLPTRDLDSLVFHQCDKELMYYKFYYQLLHHWMLDCNDYRIFLDVRTNRIHNRVAVLERCLRNSNLTSTISVQALPSHDLDLLQLSDVLTGAVGYRYHGGHSSAKWSVVETIEGHIGHQLGPTTKGEEKFNVFQFRPGGGW